MEKCPNLIQEIHFGEVFFKCGISNNALSTSYCESLCLQKTWDDCDLILDPNKLQNKGRWKEIIGLEHVKKKLIEKVQIPFIFPEKKIPTTPSIILFGPDGCGKSLLVDILAEECNAQLIKVNLRNIDSMSTFLLEVTTPTIFVLDEIDIIAPPVEQREMFLTTFRMQDPMITLMSIINDIKNSKNPFVLIGISDNPDLISPMLMKQEYVSELIYVNPPNIQSRKLILKKFLKDKPVSKDIDFEDLAEKTKNYSIYDLSKLIKAAELNWVKRSWKEETEIKMEDFYKALTEMIPSISSSMLAKFEETSRKYGVLEKEAKDKSLSWDDLGGYESIKEQLKNIEAIFKGDRNHMAFKYKLRPPKGILLFGPPGCGKTYIAKILAATTDSNFQYASAPDLLSKWLGESEKNLRDFFTLAKLNAPSILFFDELDGLAFERSRTTDHPYLATLISTFLNEISILNEDDQVLVIGATNRPEDIDPAFLRPGRIDERIPVPPPDEDARKKIFAIHLRGLPLGKIDYDELAKRTNGYTCAEIEYICESTQRAVALEAMKSGKFKKISMKHILTQIMNIKPDLSEDDIKAFKEIAERFQRRGVVSVKKIDEISLDEIGGNSDVKTFLKKHVMFPLTHSKDVKEYGLPAKMGIILFGLPGTGKSILSRALLTETKANYFVFSALELTNWFSIRESRKKFHELLHDAERVAPSIIVLQNLELIPREVAVFITNEFEKLKKDSPVILICETSDLSKIGDILLTSFEYIVPVKPPNYKERIEIFKKFAAKFPTEKNLDFEELSNRSKFFVGADILKLFKEAAQEALQRKIAGNPKILISNEDLINILDNSKPTLSPEILEAFNRQVSKIKAQKLPTSQEKIDTSFYS